MRRLLRVILTIVMAGTFSHAAKIKDPQELKTEFRLSNITVPLLSYNGLKEVLLMELKIETAKPYKAQVQHKMQDLVLSSVFDALSKVWDGKGTIKQEHAQHFIEAQFKTKLPELMIKNIHIITFKLVPTNHIKVTH